MKPSPRFLCPTIFFPVESAMSVAVNEVLTLRLSGRASRAAYVLSFVPALGLSVLSAWLSDPLAEATEPTNLAAGLLAVLAALLLLSAFVRRLHDLSYGGFAALVLLVPGVNLICLALLLVWPGKDGANRFGPDPRRIPTVRAENLKRSFRDIGGEG